MDQVFLMEEVELEGSFDQVTVDTSTKDSILSRMSMSRSSRASLAKIPDEELEAQNAYLLLLKEEFKLIPLDLDANKIKTYSYRAVEKVEEHKQFDNALNV